MACANQALPEFNTKLSSGRSCDVYLFTGILVKVAMYLNEHWALP